MPIIPLHLSESTNGEPIEVTATSSPGDLVHVAAANSGEIDEIYIDIAPASSTAKVEVEFGSTDSVEITLSPDVGYFRVVPGWRLANGAEVRVYSDNNVLVIGWVNRMVP